MSRTYRQSLLTSWKLESTSVLTIQDIMGVSVFLCFKSQLPQQHVDKAQLLSQDLCCKRPMTSRLIDECPSSWVGNIDQGNDATLHLRCKVDVLSRVIHLWGCILTQNSISNANFFTQLHPKGKHSHLRCNRSPYLLLEFYHLLGPH